MYEVVCEASLWSFSLLLVQRLPRAAWSEPATTCSGRDTAILEDNFTPADGYDRPAGYFATDVNGKATVGQSVLVTDGAGLVRIPDDEVGV